MSASSRPAASSQTSRFARVELDPLLPLVERPQRYVGAERLTRGTTLSESGVNWALCFPETYELGMSHLGLKALYQILNDQSEVVADRAFAPWPDMEAVLRERGVPLYGHESRVPLAAFDLLGFSLQYELTWTNVLTMLDLAGVPLHASDRVGEQPIVIGGGPNVSNPEPLARFFDAFLIGDGEEAVLAISRVVRQERGDRVRLLEALARVPGVYVPRFYAAVELPEGRIAGHRLLRPGLPERVARVWVEDLAATPYPTDPVVPVVEVVQDRYAIEVSRGCTQGCRYCQAGYWYRPVRERSAEQVRDLARDGVRAGGYDAVSLCSLSVADHSQVEELARGVADAVGDDQVSIGLPSLRADRFSVGLAETVGEVKRNGFTFAPETGSERLRRVINKNITDAALLEAIETAYRRGWNLVKLYFMIGLPTETLADVESIVTLVDKVNAVGKRVGGGKRVTVSVGAFVPKAWTPFQWDAFAGLEDLEPKLALLKDRLRRNRFVRFKWHDPRVSWLEAVLSLGDRRLGAVIEAAWRRGARFDGWHECFERERWVEAFAETGIDPAWSTRGRDPEEALPWEVIDASVSREFLLRERRRSHAERLTRDCRWGACGMCGIPGAPDDIRLAGERAAAPGEGTTAPDDIRLAGERAAVPGEGTTVSTTRRRHRSRRQTDDATQAVTLRVYFRSDGVCRFISHHDRMRAVQRACRMVGAPLRFTQGFSPRPRIAFGPPLPMGVGGEREAFEVELTRPVLDLAEQLNAVLPAGLECLEARLVPHRGPSLSARARWADYSAQLPEDLLGADRRARLDAFHAAETMPVVKSRPGKPEREIDLKRAISRLTLDEDGRLEFRLVLQEPGGHETRAPAVLTQLLGLDREQAARVRVTRLALRDLDGEEL